MSHLEQIINLEQRFLLPTYNRYPVGFERGKGVFLYDFEGKKYLDFVAGLGVNALGHAHPRIVKAIREQAARVIHISNLYYNEYQGQLAERLCQLSGSNFDRVFFSNSGTEAMEGAIKLARYATGRDKIIAFFGSFHGRTMGALSLTSRKAVQRVRRLTIGIGKLRRQRIPGAENIDRSVDQVDHCSRRPQARQRAMRSCSGLLRGKCASRYSIWSAITRRPFKKMYSA